MYNLGNRKNTNNILNQDASPTASYRPLRRQASMSQHTTQVTFQQNSTTTSKKSTQRAHFQPNMSQEARQKSITKVDYPRQATDIFNLGKHVRTQSYNRSNKLLRYENLFTTDASPLNIQRKRSDHSKEYLFHCIEETQFIPPKPQQLGFIPKFKEETAYQKRQKDFIRDEIALNQIIPKVQYQSPSKEEVYDEQQFRKSHPKQSDKVSNIFAVPGKDYLNENHILRKFETKNDLNETYGKSVSHPWLTKKDIQGTLVNEQAEFNSSYAQNRKQQQLKISEENVQAQSLSQSGPKSYSQIVQEPNKTIYEQNTPNEWQNNKLDRSDKIERTDYGEDRSPLRDSNIYERTRSNGRIKSDLISPHFHWDQFDSTLHGKGLKGQQKSDYPQYHNKRKPQTDINNDENDTQIENQLVGSVHNKYYNVKTPTKEKNDNVDVITLDMDAAEFMEESRLRNICRQNGFHLVNYDQKYNKITNKQTGQGKITIRSSQQSNQHQQSYSNLKQSLGKQGIEARESESHNGLKQMTSKLYLQQEQQMKDLQELEQYYKEQAKTFIKSGTRNQKSVSQLKPSGKKSKYSHAY